MRDGEVVADGPVNETTLPKVVTQMVGRKVETSRRQAHVRASNEVSPLMTVENLSLSGLSQNVSFSLRSGEVSASQASPALVFGSCRRDCSGPRAARPLAESSLGEFPFPHEIRQPR